jgi:AcrR family transcriptional regulator
MEPLTKGEKTRAAILDEAVRIASKLGLEGLTIGSLADATGMSKSGLFAHFGSREELQLAVLDRGREKFGEAVLKPALGKPRGVPRLRAAFANWLDWTESAELPGGCVMLGAAVEFDDQPGPVRDRVAALQREWMDSLARTVRGAIEEGHLRRDTDVEQFVFEAFGIAFVCHHHRRLFGDKRARGRALAAQDALIARHAGPAPAARLRAVSR